MLGTSLLATTTISNYSLYIFVIFHCTYFKETSSPKKFSEYFKGVLTISKNISPDWQCQNVPLSITDMFVIDHKEKVSWINHQQFCD